MTKPEACKTILIVDDDLGYCFLLGETLTEAGYQTLPATNGQDALSLLSELRVEVDLLIVNPACSGTGELIQALRRSERQPTIIAITEATEQPGAAPVPGVDAFLGRSAEGEVFSQAAWLRTVRRVLGDDAVGGEAGGGV